MRLKRSFFPWIFFHICEFIPYYILALGSLYILHVSQVKIPKLAKELGDSILIKNFQKDQILTFLSLAVLILIFRTLSRWLFFYPARVQQKTLRTEILEMIKNAYPSQYADYSFGQIYQILLNDINRLRGLIGFALLQVGNIIIASWVLIPKISEIDSRIFVAFLPMLVSVFVFSLLIFVFQPYLEKATKAQGDVQNILIETFDAKGSIANYQKEQSFLENFLKTSHIELENFFKASIGPAFSRPLVPLGMSLSLLWGAYIIQDLNLGVTTIILYSGFLYLALEPLMFLSWIGIVTATALTGWKRVKKLVSNLDENIEPKGSVEEVDDELSVETYLWDSLVSLKIKKEKFLGLCGRTASGKSHLLFQIADLCHKENISFSLVLQEPHLFNDTVLNNLCLGRENIKKEKIEKLLEIFELNQLESREENVLELVVGENGKKLSGGQIKRMALAQSLLSDSQVLLWDDPFSSVDNILEKSIFDKLINEKFLENKYLVFSSHRITTMNYASQIHLINEKRVQKYTSLSEGNLYEFFRSQRD